MTFVFLLTRMLIVFGSGRSGVRRGGIIRRPGEGRGPSWLRS
jgi:hypothetical protein